MSRKHIDRIGRFYPSPATVDTSRRIGHTSTAGLSSTTTGGAIDEVAGQVTSATADIASNTAAIAAATSDIASATSDIASNTSAIATVTNDVAGLQRVVNISTTSAPWAAPHTVNVVVTVRDGDGTTVAAAHPFRVQVFENEGQASTVLARVGASGVGSTIMAGTIGGEPAYIFQTAATGIASIYIAGAVFSTTNVAAIVDLVNSGTTGLTYAATPLHFTVGQLKS